MSTKIAIIGAGSAVFSIGLVKDLCLTPGLSGTTVSFMDIDPGRLEVAYTLCARYAGELGAHLRLEKTLDRKEALEGADFVVNTALAAGHHRLREGWAIAQQLGYRFGGSYHVMHDEAFWVNFYQLRLIESVIQDGLAICPDAWHLLVANPVLAGVTYLGRRYPQAKVVGLCQGFRAVYRVAQALGLDPAHLTFEVPGVNHFVWLTRCFHKGEDVFPMLDAYLAQRAGTENPCGDLRPVDVDLYRRLGVYPIGDTTSAGGGAWPWWHHTDEEAELRWRDDPVAAWARHFRGVDDSVAEAAAAAHDPTVKVSERFPPTMSGEAIIPLIEAIVCNVPRVLIGNILNIADFVPGIPRNFEVEIPLFVSKHGVQGIRTNRLPDAVVALALREMVAPANIELQAYEEGRRELLLQLIMLDPWTRSEDQARRLLDEIFALPYHQEMREHFR